MTDCEVLKEAVAYLKGQAMASSDSCPDCDPRVMAALHLLEDADYLEKYEKSGSQEIEEMSLEELSVMYTFILRGERFCDGHIASFVENGMLYRLFLRHLELLSGGAGGGSDFRG